MEIESIEHIIFRCHLASKVWDLLPQIKSFEFPSITSISNWMDASLTKADIDDSF